MKCGDIGGGWGQDAEPEHNMNIIMMRERGEEREQDNYILSESHSHAQSQSWEPAWTDCGTVAICSRLYLDQRTVRHHITV